MGSNQSDPGSPRTDQSAEHPSVPSSKLAVVPADASASNRVRPRPEGPMRQVDFSIALHSSLTAMPKDQLDSFFSCFSSTVSATITHRVDPKHQKQTQKALLDAVESCVVTNTKPPAHVAPKRLGRSSLDTDLETRLLAGHNSTSHEETRALKLGPLARAVEAVKHLPTDVLLIFEVLTPWFTNGGNCNTTSRVMTALLIAGCSLACFLFCFTDSFVDSDGVIRYVFATKTGACIIGGTQPPPLEVANYRLKRTDYFHAILSLFLFLCVAMFDKNVCSCLYPVMSYDTVQVLTNLRLLGVLVGALLFSLIPSMRHQIRPLTSVTIQRAA